MYAGGAYLLAMANLAYIVGFLINVGVPKGINDGPDQPMLFAILIDCALVALFGLHHSTTARRWFKLRWTKIIPEPMERATYLYMTAAMTWLLVALWRPIPITLWQVDDSVIAGSIIGVYLLTWTMMFAATFHFGHMSFFGLRQALDLFRRKKPIGSSFSARYLYALVRHPISLGWMLTPWLTPHMTVGSLVFALSITAYVLVATRFEERDLIAELGDDYDDYKMRVPAFVPGTSRAQLIERSFVGMTYDDRAQSKSDSPRPTIRRAGMREHAGSR